MQLLAVAQFGFADTRVLGRTAQGVALLHSDLVIRVALVLLCLLACVGLLHRSLEISKKALSKAEKSEDRNDHYHETNNPNDLVHGFSSITVYRGSYLPINP
jgi:hypothetical protein